ncbi:MAG TPA: HD-GYP domain-containing protein [bacterium]|nr:HD-GYP domain-containing protein [bacterium]
MVRWFLYVSIPSVALGILAQHPALDVQWELSWAHLVLVSAAGVVGIVLATLLARVAAKTENARIIILALAFHAMGVFLVVHALLTPETLLPIATTGTEWTLILGFLLCSVLLAASSYRYSPPTQQTITRVGPYLFLVVMAVALLAALAAVRYPAFLALGGAPSSEEGYESVNMLIVAGGSLLAFAALAAATVPYYRDFRLTGLPFPHAMVTGLLILQVSAVAFATSATWHVRWWEYHVLLLAGLGVILLAVLREAARRNSVSEVFATLLVGDTVGKLEHSYAEVLQAFVDIVEARHADTHGHSARVARLSTRIGEELGLSPERLRALHQTALLHDVGKIVVPDVILNKPGKLTPGEFALVASHTTVGDDLIRRIPPLAFARPGIRWHHERLDGSGYPDGLKGEAIPLEARIVAVADTYDAMTSARPYRSASSTATAVAELQERAGSEYDGSTVTALANHLRHAADPGTAAAPARLASPSPSPFGRSALAIIRD